MLPQILAIIDDPTHGEVFFQALFRQGRVERPQFFSRQGKVTPDLDRFVRFLVDSGIGSLYSQLLAGG